MAKATPLALPLFKTKKMLVKGFCEITEDSQMGMPTSFTRENYIVEGLRRYTDDSTGFQLEVTYERGTLTVVMCMWDDGDETLLDVAVDDVAAAQAAFVSQAVPAIKSTGFGLHTIRPA